MTVDLSFVGDPSDPTRTGDERTNKKMPAVTCGHFNWLDWQRRLAVHLDGRELAVFH
jgi:hypothetical protein